MRFIDAAADLLLGSACPSCRTPGWGLCPDCRAELGRGAFLVPDLVVQLPVWAAEPYRPVMSACLPAFKDADAWHLARVLGDCLALAVRGGFGDYPTVALVPVPSWGAKVRSRGIDHTGVLARTAGRRCGRRVSRVLRRTRSSPDQGDLGRSGRLKGQRDSMRASSGSGAVIVVDDVATTGATLAEAVRALQAAGWTPVGCAVVAAALRSEAAGSVQRVGGDTIRPPRPKVGELG